MSRAVCYRFKPDVPLDEVEDSLSLAALAAEGLHGRSRVRLEARFVLDYEAHECRISAVTEVGRDLARIFTGLVSQQFGEEGYELKAEDPDALGPR